MPTINQNLSDLTTMKNIGKEMSEKLLSAGITSPKMLKEVGAKQAFVKIKKIYSYVCLTHLYTLQGAVEDIAFNRLSEQTKNELKLFYDTLQVKKKIGVIRS